MPLGMMCQEGCNVTSGDLLPIRHYLNSWIISCLNWRTFYSITCLCSLKVFLSGSCQEVQIKTEKLLQIKGDLTTKSNKWVRTFFCDAKGCDWDNWRHLNEVCGFVNERGSMLIFLFWSLCCYIKECPSEHTGVSRVKGLSYLKSLSMAWEERKNKVGLVKC